MTLNSLINRPCVLLQRTDSGARDSYGNRVMTDTTVDTVCELQQAGASEDDQQGETSDEDWVAYFLPSEDLTTADAVVVGGETYELVGEPWLARNPRTGTDSHLEVKLRRTAGAEAGS